MSRAKKLKKTLVEQILDKAGIAHEGLALNALEGKLDDLPREHIFKTLALHGDKTGPLIGIVPITSHLSEKKLAQVSGNKKVTIRQKHRYPIYIDQVALEMEEMIVSAGEIGRSVKVNSQQLASFVGADFADLME